MPADDTLRIAGQNMAGALVVPCWDGALCWLVIIPGLIYSIWRRSNRRELCAACGSDKVVPIASPIGQQLAQSAGHTPEPPRQSSPAAVGLGRSLGRLAGRLKR